MRRFMSWQMGPKRDGEPDAGGGGGEPPAFDPAKFMADVTKMINGFDAKINKQLAALKPAAPPTSDPDPDPGDDKSKPADTKLARQLAKLTEELAQEKQARIDATNREKESTRKSALKTELGKHVDPAKVDAAFKIFNGDVKLNEAGEVVAGPDELPLNEYLAAQMPSYEYLLPPRPVGGSGAAAGGRRGTPAATLDDIKAGMSAETRAQVLAAIQAAR